MIGARALRLVALDLRRQAGRLAAAGVGVTVAVAALVFFLALALGVRAVLLGEVFPVDRVEVAPVSRSLDLLALRFELGADVLSDAQLAELASQPGVAAVYPKLKLAVPALASGGESLLGTALQTEVVADGVEPGLVSGEVGDSFTWAEIVSSVPCASNADCADGAYCGDGIYGPIGKCRSRVPVLVSNHLLEMYNGSFRRAYGLPRLNPAFAVGLEFEMAFGASTLRAPHRGRVLRERMRIAGFSDAAIPLGVTLPLEFVRWVNTSLQGAGTAEGYQSAVVRVSSKGAVPSVVAAIQSMGLEVKDRGAEQAATLMAVVLTVVATVGGAMIAVAAVSVGHALFMIVLVRRREIGVLRALGARRSDVRATVLAEATVLGGAAGGVGVAVAVGAASVVDWLGRSRIPDFPYKPDSFFVLPWWLVLAAVAMAVMACVVGGLLPARRVAAQDPADALTAL